MSITEERKRQIDFSAKYYQTPARLVAKKDAGFEGTDAGLTGKRIGVIFGAYFTETFRGAITAAALYFLIVLVITFAFRKAETRYLRHLTRRTT